MRLLHLEPQLKRNYLYESLDNSGRDSIILWETAGVKLKEAALTADQIQGLFKEIETAQTAAGGNRTMLGKGKDAASAVNKAWEDLKTKIQDSGPVKDFDQKVSDVLSKIGMGAEDPQFQGEVSGWVQKYRKFAKEHPILQGAIYATLIALAGISGAGVGGAVALGLLKMADQLLQGKRASSAAYSGVKAGAMAFAASKLGDLIKGMKPGDQVPKVIDGQDIVDIPGVPKMDFQKYDYYLGDSGNVVAVPKGMGNPFTGGGGAGGIGNIDGADLVPSGAKITDLSNRIFDQSLSNVEGRHAARQAVSAALKAGDLTAEQGKELIKQIGSAAANPEAAERVIAQTLQNVGGSAAKSAAKSAGTSIADIASSVSDLPVGGGIKAPDFDPGDLPKGADSVSSGGGATLEKPSAGLKYDIIDGAKTVDFGGSKYTFAGLGETPPEGVEIVNKVKGSQGMIGIRGIKPVTLSLGSDGKYYNLGDSVIRTGRALSEGQVYMVFNRVVSRNDQMLSEGRLVEGPLDAIKGAAGKAMDWAKTKGKNLTTKITADKLNSAWQKAGSPTDSNAVADFLKAQGVADTVVSTVYQQLKLPEPGAAAAGPEAGAVDIESVKQMIAKLPTERKIRLINYMKNQLKVA
jgi:hypothetical protein